MVKSKKVNSIISEEVYENIKVFQSNQDDTFNFIERKKKSNVLSETFLNTSELPIEMPLNSTARSVNSPASGSTGGTPPRQGWTPKNTPFKATHKQIFSKFNPLVTPAQMDPFLDSSFKITKNSDDTMRHGQFLQIDNTLEEDIIKSTVRRRPNVKTILYNNTTYNKPILEKDEQEYLLSEETILKRRVLKLISKIVAGTLTFVIFFFLIYIVYLLFSKFL